jgi:hypothetical protein
MFSAGTNMFSENSHLLSSEFTAPSLLFTRYWTLGLHVLFPPSSSCLWGNFSEQGAKASVPYAQKTL